MEPAEFNIPKSLRRNIEKSVDSIIDNHLNFKVNVPISSTVDSIVENILKSEEIKQLTTKMSADDNFYQFEDLSINTNIISFETSDVHENDLELLVQNPLNSVRDHKTWAQEAKSLRKNLLSKTNEHFISSYKIHLKLLSHSETINEGVLNIIKALKSYYLSTSKQYVTPNYRINLRAGAPRNILKITNMLLQALEKIHKNYKNQLTESIIVLLLELLILPTYGKRIHVLHNMAVLDPKATWFKYLLNNSFYRSVIINFITQNTSLIEYLTNEIFLNMYAENELYLKTIQINSKCEILHSIIKVATFCHCLHIIGHLLSFKQGQMLFPNKIKMNEELFCAYSFVILLLDTVKNFAQVPSQKQKRNMIVMVLKQIVVKNYYLLNYPDVVQKFIEPLIINDTPKNTLPEIAVNNIHIFEITEKICKMKDGYLPLFGFNTLIKNEENWKYRNRKNQENIDKFVPVTSVDKLIKSYILKDKDVSIIDYIINFTTMILRSYINNSKKYSAISNVPFILLKYCTEILTAHNHILYWCKTKKLTLIVRDLYKYLSDQNQFSEQMTELENFLFAICTTSNTINYLQDEQDILLLFGLNYMSRADNHMWNQKYFNVFILNLSVNTYGSQALYERSERISIPKLENVWKMTENQSVFLSGSDRFVTEAIYKFLKTVLTYTMELKLFQIVLKDNQDDTVTLTEDEHNPMNIFELITDTLHTYGPGTYVNYTGLLALSILISNMDIYLYLENKFSIHEHLLRIQEQSCVTSSETHIVKDTKSRKSESRLSLQPQNSPLIIDECSLLRRDIIDQICNMGVLSCKSANFKQVKSSPSRDNMYPSRKQANELQKFLKETKNSLHDNGWIMHVRRSYKLIIDDTIKEGLIIEAIKQAKIISPINNSELKWPSSETELGKLHPEEIRGVSVIVKYGVQNRLLSNCSQNEDCLAQLLKQSKVFLGSTKDEFCGFDWFTSVIFLICGGSTEKSRSVLSLIADLQMAPYIWPAFRTREKDTTWSKFEFNLILLLHCWDNLDTVMDAGEIPVGAMAKFMLNQCFLNILEWNEICHFLLMSILYTPDYLVFYFVAMFGYMRDNVIRNFISTDVTVFEKILHQDGFKMKYAMPIMESMAKQFKHLL